MFGFILENKYKLQLYVVTEQVLRALMNDQHQHFILLVYGMLFAAEFYIITWITDNVKCKLTLSLIFTAVTIIVFPEEVERL